jgi:Tfp pilus assembly PilM family ATPase
MPNIKSTVVGIEFHDHLAQFVELGRSRKGFSLKCFHRVLLPDGLIVNGEIEKEEELKLALKDFFKQGNPRAPRLKHAALIVPARLSFAHIFEFPASFSDSDVRKAIPFQAETVIPFNIEDVYWDVFVIDKSKEKKGIQKVLFAAIKKETADAYARVLDGLGVTPFLFGVHVQALGAALKNNLGPEPSLIIDIGAIASNYLFVEGMSLKHFFSSNEGTESLIRAIGKEFKIKNAELYSNWEAHKNSKKYSDKIQDFILKRCKQALKILKEKEKEGLIQPIEKIFLTGEFSNLPNVLELVQKHFPEQVVSIGDPKLGLNIEDTQFLKNKDKIKGETLYSIYFTNVLGIARVALETKRGSHINLLPENLKQRFSNRRIGFIMSASILGMTFIALMISGFLLYQHGVLSIQRNSLANQKTNIDRTLYGTRYQEIHADLTEFNNEVAELVRIDASLVSVPSILDQLYELTPSTITLNSIQYYDIDLSIELSGVASTREELLSYQRSLEETDFIDSVDLPLSNFDDKVNISFAMNVYLNFIELPEYAADTTE